MNHKQRKHSIISPSNSKEWLNCTASPFMQQDLDEEEESEFAREGTLAHEIAELMLKIELIYKYGERLVKHKLAIDTTDKLVYFDYEKSTVEAYLYKLELLKKHELYHVEMIDQIYEYIHACMSVIDYGSVVYIEPEISLEVIASGMKGHIDFVNYNVRSGKLVIIDLKFGRGVEVVAKDNSQLALYAIGFCDTFLVAPNEIILQIVQPRRWHTSSWIITFDQMAELRTQYFTIAGLIMRGEVELNVGSHCKWCMAKIGCPKMHQEVEGISLVADTDIKYLELTETEIERFLNMEGVVTNFFNLLRAEILRRLSLGERLELFKLVEGRRTTKVLETINLASELEALGFSENEIYKKSLRTLTELKSSLKTKNFKQFVEPRTYKAKGNVSVVSVNDVRESINGSADIDFKDLNLDEL